MRCTYPNKNPRVVNHTWVLAVLGYHQSIEIGELKEIGISGETTRVPCQNQACIVGGCRTGTLPHALSAELILQKFKIRKMDQS